MYALLDLPPYPKPPPSPPLPDEFDPILATRLKIPRRSRIGPHRLRFVTTGILLSSTLLSRLLLLDRFRRVLRLPPYASATTSL